MEKEFEKLVKDFGKTLISEGGSGHGWLIRSLVGWEAYLEPQLEADFLCESSRITGRSSTF